MRAVDGEGHASPYSDRSHLDPAVTGVEPGAPALLEDRVATPAPNFFNPTATAAFVVGIGSAGAYRVTIHDAAGRRLGVLAEGFDDGRGRPRAVRLSGLGVGGRELAFGVYLLCLETVRGITSRKFAILR